MMAILPAGKAMKSKWRMTKFQKTPRLLLNKKFKAKAKEKRVKILTKMNFKTKSLRSNIII